MGKGEIILQGGNSMVFVGSTSAGKLTIGVDGGFKMYLGSVAEERLRRFLNDRYSSSVVQPQEGG